MFKRDGILSNPKAIMAQDALLYQMLTRPLLLRFDDDRGRGQFKLKHTLSSIMHLVLPFLIIITER